LLDYNLETMTAPEIVPKVRALPLGRSLPIIIYTSSTEPANASSAYQAGADHFLTKPGRLSRVKFILETLYVAAASKAKGYSPLMALPEYLRPDLAALSASHHQPEA
jgi:CheY-like chemotaxis protein